MSKNKNIWNTKENAKAYDLYTKTFPMYKNTSSDLVTVADIKLGMTVVDLAAGTGVTTEAILNKTNSNVHVIAVDQAEEMLKQAHEKFTDGNVQFVTSEAENLDKVITEPVDVVICNSAFWQMKMRSTIAAVSNILKVGGIFAFNLPDSFFSYKEFKKQPIKPTPYNLDELTTYAKEVGLNLVSATVKEYDKTVDDTLAFNEIPVMKRNFQTKDEKKQYIARITKNPQQKREWVYFVFKK